jgi:hypothetical protein
MGETLSRLWMATSGRDPSTLHDSEYREADLISQTRQPA